MSRADERQAWVLAALDRYEVRLVRYAMSLVGDLDLARDAVQHAFVKLCDEHLPNGRERPPWRSEPHESDDHLAAWLFRVCRNRALDHLRRAGREQSADGLTDDREGRELDPAVASEAHELAECLRELSQRLPASQREALGLWCEGFVYREIGEIIGRQEGHVRVLVHRGLTRLREHPQVRGWLDDETTTADLRPRALTQ